MWYLARYDVSTIVRRGIQSQEMDSDCFATNVVAPLREEFIP
jgi:hypothetical protein